MMEKRAIAAILLSVLVLFAFRMWEERRLAEEARKHPISTAVASRDRTKSIGLQPPGQEIKPPAGIPPAEAPTGDVRVVGDTNTTPIRLVIEGGLYRAVLDSQGATLTGWELKQFKSARGQPFEMMAANYFPETRPYAGSLILDDPALTKRANWEHYELNTTEGTAAEGILKPPVVVIARLRRGDFLVEKRFRFDRDNYMVDLTVTAERSGRPLPGKIFIGQDIGPEQEHLINPAGVLVAVSERDGKVHRDKAPSDDKEVKKFEGAIHWSGLDMQYFAIIAIASPPLRAFDIQKLSVKTEGLEGKEIARDLLRLTVPSDGSTHLGLYIGPKQQMFLESAAGADLSKVVDYGTFSFLVRPLLVSLKWIDAYVHNYGAAIILLTLGLTLLLFPFRLKQMLSMKKMAVVQPKVKEIQERYKRYKKTDPRRSEMNKEIMDLYKQHNVNPLGGCLPLVLQMPLLFAFYALLAYSIELRQAPFAGWIHDLSVKDPYYILPIVMGITMLISQRMTPMSPGMDPAQAKMMMVMPAVFTIMFLNVSCGLNLYFLCSNIFQIAFQKIAERWVGDGRVAAKS
jgi:YidC/Oxa1 family membrane protein insertase